MILLNLLCLAAAAVVAHSYTPAFRPAAVRARVQRVGRSTYLTETVYPNEIEKGPNTNGMEFSTLNGKALVPKEYPSLAEVKRNLPSSIFVKNTPLALGYAALDIATVAACLLFSGKFVLPLVKDLLKIPSMTNKAAVCTIWVLYSIITGTCAIGSWVTAHECGHGAFSDNRKLQDIVGYIFHSLLLVPYYAWQRSHALHHANTNHIMDGETHVPPVKPSPETTTKKQILQRIVGNRIGEFMYGSVQMLLHLVAGWPAYLLTGATGGPSRGYTNHFVPWQFPMNPGQTMSNLKRLFPQGMQWKLWLSDVGVGATIGLLYLLGRKFGFPLVAAAYLGPYTVVNAWLVGYTWLQHTDVDVPHLPADNYSFMKGAFHTVDRPYEQLLGGLVNFLHHDIGTTHVLHHIDCTVPHYNAREGTEALKKAYPDLYLYESTPIFKALWRLARKCFMVEKRQNANQEEIYVFVD
mmetsp:Transcript_23752/g.39717  ORF Transcript_23752/g.39717 Transcript_23752/m.39717 type:complete len:465 (+) Transcript_23752:43-1437(+)